MLTSERKPDQALPQRSARNQSMECCKLVASFFVVFIHARFPGDLGGLMDCLGHFAVPLFFMISGYFNYRASGEDVTRRTIHIVKLLLLGTGAHLLYGCVATELNGGSTIMYLRSMIPGPGELIELLVLHKHPIAGHLWYLNALIVCYLVFLLYTRFWDRDTIDYRPFYGLCLCLFTVCFVCEVILPVAGGEVPYLVCRNGWLIGLPMFAAGLFLHEYQDRIFRVFRFTAKTFLLLILGGLLLSVLQWKASRIGLLPFGMLLTIPGLMLFLVSHPRVPVRSEKAQRAVLKCGPLSTWIYLFHLIFTLFYEEFCKQPLAAVLGGKEPYLFPLIVLAMSVLTAIVWDSLLGLGKKLLRSRKKP